MDKAQVAEAIRGSKLREFAGVIAEHLLSSARVIVENRPSTTTVSHFGGAPALPRDMSWPVWDRREFLLGQISRLEARFKANPRATGLRDAAVKMNQDLSSALVPLSFLAQLDLAEIHASAPLPGWPRAGSLAFFYDSSQSASGFDPRSRGFCRVLFLRDDQKLIETPLHGDIPKEARFPRRALRFSHEWTLPTTLTSDQCELSIWRCDEYHDLYQRIMPATDEREPVHRVGGHPQEIQGDMRLECQLVTNGIYCGDPSGYADPRRPLLEQGAADWRLLLQVDSDEKRLGWMWGDVGRVYFWARRQDIEATDFSSSWAALQCY